VYLSIGYPIRPGFNLAIASNELISQKQLCGVGGPVERPQIEIIFSVAGHLKSY
jgi:hypothetical protein